MKSVRRRRFSFVHKSILVVVSALLLSASAGIAQVECGDAKKITRLGNPTTRFSSSVTSVAALQSLVSNSRADVATLLAQAGYQGDAEDFFAAVASGDGVSTTSVDPGTTLGWMFFRKKGAPELKRNVCWAGKAPFKAFEIQFSSKGTWYSFVVPEACGNLSFLAQQTEPICRVTLQDTAGETCDQKDLLIDATGSTGNVVVELTGPSGRTQTLSSSNASGSLRWTVPAEETEGNYRVVARSSELTPRGNTLECSATQSVVRACCIAEPPTISLTATPDSVELFQDSVITANPGVSKCTTLEEVTIDGSKVSSPYQVTANYKEPGVYTVAGSVRDGRGQSANAEVDITVSDCVTKDCKKQRKVYRKEQRRRERQGLGRNQETDGVVGTKKSLEGEDEASMRGGRNARTRGGAGAAAGAWIVRGWLNNWDASDEVRFAQGDEREAFRLDNGSGAGVQAERLFNERVGLGFGALVGQADVHYELDFPDAWGMGKDDASALTLFVGPVFHLSPGSKVDVIVSPFVGYTDFGGASFRTLGRSVKADFESEFSWGAQIGVDIPFGGDWGLHAGALYQALDMESKNQGFTFQADPLSLTVGLFFRF